MKRFTIFGSRVFFWLLALWVVGGLLFFPYLAYYEISATEMFGSIVALILFLWCVFLLLAAVVPGRFGWLIYLITGTISLSSVFYCYDSYFVRGQSILRNPDALHALDLYGVHFLVFTIIGLRSKLTPKNYHDL